jgi:hypothetical protein
MNEIYAGTAKFIVTKYGPLPKVSFNRDNLKRLLQYMDDNATDWVNLDVKEKKEKVDGKPTHFLQVDEYKGNGNKEKKEYNPTPAKNEMVNKFEINALPF